MKVFLILDFFSSQQVLTSIVKPLADQFDGMLVTPALFNCGATCNTLRSSKTAGTFLVVNRKSYQLSC